MKGLFRKIFNIHAGEEKNAFLFASLGFLWALGITLGLKFADALFLLHVGAESLPIAYGITACIMIILTAFLLKAFHLIRIDHIFIAVLLAGSYFYTFAFFCLTANIGIESQWLWFAFKIAGSMLFAIAVTCFWTFIDQYYHLQDAKRLYSLFTSTIFLGIATTGAIMRSGILEFQHVILVIIALLLLASFWIVRIAKRIKPVYDENALENIGEPKDNTFKFLIHSILKSKFTLLLMTGNFLVYLFLVITEYNYLSAFDLYFDPGINPLPGGEEKARLTQFLGECIGIISIINLFFGLFVYSRLVRKFGVSNLLLFTPIFLLVTYGGWSVSDALLFPLMGIFIVEGMLYMIEDNNFTLLLSAVPAKVKYKIRLVIESFFEPTGMLVSSLLLMFSPFNSKVLGLIIAGVGVCLALLLRRRYLNAIYLTLADNAIHFRRTAKDWFSEMSHREKKAAERRLLEILKQEDETAQVLAIEGLLNMENSHTFSKLLELVNHLSSNTKITFLQLLSKTVFADHPRVKNTLYDWMKDAPDNQLKGTIHFYLAQHGWLLPNHTFGNLESTDPTLKGAAILSLKIPKPDLSAEDNSINMKIADEYLHQMLESGDEKEICIGIKLLGFDHQPSHLNILIPYLQHSSLEISRQAAESIAQNAGHESAPYAPTLISSIASTDDSDIRISCLRALGKIGNPTLVREIITSSSHFRPNERRFTETVLCSMGSDILPTLLEIIQDVSMPDKCRILAGRTLGRHSLPILRRELPQIVISEIERAYFYYYHHHVIPSQYPEYDLTLLKDDLLSSFHSVLDFIIQLLGIAGEIEDSELLSRSLRSPNPKIRSHVMEALERTCEPNIYRALYPLIADLSLEDRMQFYLKGGRPTLSLTELLDKMSTSTIKGDQITAIALKYRLNLPFWREALRKQMDSRERIIHHFAYELLES